MTDYKANWLNLAKSDNENDRILALEIAENLKYEIQDEVFFWFCTVEAFNHKLKLFGLLNDENKVYTEWIFRYKMSKKELLKFDAKATFKHIHYFKNTQLKRATSLFIADFLNSPRIGEDLLKSFGLASELFEISYNKVSNEVKESHEINILSEDFLIHELKIQPRNKWFYNLFGNIGKFLKRKNGT